LDTTRLRRGPPSVVDLQVTRGFRWGISMSRSGESYASVVTGDEAWSLWFSRAVSGILSRTRLSHCVRVYRPFCPLATELLSWDAKNCPEGQL
jgi:hypothetical protein